MPNKKVTLVTTTETSSSRLVVVDKFDILVTEGCTQMDEWKILGEFIQMVTRQRNAGGWSAILKNRPKHCSLRFIDVSDVLKRNIVLEAIKYYKEVKEV